MEKLTDDIVAFAHSTRNNTAPILSAQYQPEPEPYQAPRTVKRVRPTQLDEIPPGPRRVVEVAPAERTSREVRDYIASQLAKIQTPTQERAARYESLREYYRLLHGEPAPSMRKDKLLALLRQDLGMA